MFNKPTSTPRPLTALFRRPPTNTPWKSALTTFCVPVITTPFTVCAYLITRDERFTARAFENFNSLLSRALLISSSGEKERSRFFNALRDKVHALKA